MKQKTIWSWQSLLLCLFFNGLLGLSIYVPFQKELSTINQYVLPVMSKIKSGETLPPEFGQVVTNIKDLITIADQYGTVIIWGTVAIITCALWLSLLLVGRKRIDRALEEAKKESLKNVTVPQRSNATSTPIESVVKTGEEGSMIAAFQLLSVFQREGRFIDFLREDLSLYDDSQIGAAVRNLQESWKKVFQEYISIEPVFSEPEGSQVTISAGFDPNKIKLTGDVIGEPPFEGVVMHRGWKLVKINLPAFTAAHRREWIIAPAEIEVHVKGTSET
ncbi:MAG: DUF2760 domain-containing protein [Syntrophobacterales bacterium]|nr:DUF2760 domain-containing protein [Syntrophobacterales bacterium]